MNPSRFHSARRNKRWQACAILGCILILTFWWLCSQYNSHGYFMLSRDHCFLVMAGGGSIDFGIHRSCSTFTFTTQFGIEPESPPRFLMMNGLLPSVHISNGDYIISIPCLFLLYAFLTLYYLLLPKSLPVTEEK